jgi:trimethylamine:corrinoid methyltransferase-like protein
MAQAIKSIHNPKVSLNILSEAEVNQIHTATLEVMESVGVKFPSPKALDILEAHGAQIDRQTMVAKIPGHLVEENLAKAPPTYTLAALDPTLDLPLDGTYSHLGTDGCGVEILDAFSGERRTTTKQDVQDVARVADFLDEIAFHWVPISAQDCPPQSRGLHELEAVWSVSKKHVQTETIVSEREMKAAIEMAASLVGGRDALRHAVHPQPAGAGRRQPGSRVGGSRGGPAGRLYDHGVLRLVRTGDAGGQPGGGECRSAGSADLDADGSPGLPGVLCRCSNSHRPAHRRIYWRWS